MFLSMPIVVFFWFFGWSLYWAGSVKFSTKLVENENQEELAFEVIMPEQQYA
jgi:hypothetical protein